ncbi:MAG: helix-turn-helix domain-containing protein [Dehalococcoidia bacterium]
MKWDDLQAEWNADPEHVEAIRRAFPYRRVADAIVGLRARYRLTQTQLATLTGTQQSVIALVESGKHSVEVKMLNRIASALGLDRHPCFEEIAGGVAINVTAGSSHTAETWPEISEEGSDAIPGLIRRSSRDARESYSARRPD